MLTSMSSRLFRLLLSLVIRLRRSVGRIALAFQARFASLWRSILTFARRQSQIRLHASDDVRMVGTSQMGGPPQIPEPAMVSEEGNEGTLAALPVRRIANWPDEISRYQPRDSTLSYPSEFDPLPATPEGGSPLYKFRVIGQNVKFTSIPAGQQEFLSASPSPSNGWERHVHPGGNVYFYHKGLRIFTETDITRGDKEVLFYAKSLIQKAIRERDVILDDLTEIVLNVKPDRRWCYYFVDHTNRLLFWVHPVKVREDLGTDLQAITGYSHIKYLLKARYWYASHGFLGMSTPYIVHDMESRSHCEYYPHNRVLPKSVFEDVRGMLNYAKTGMITTGSSSSPFAQDELAAIPDLLESLKDDKKISDAYDIWAIARLMAFFTEDQFLKFYDQLNARVTVDTLFLQQTWSHSIPFRVVIELVNLFTFGSLKEHAVRLQRVRVGGRIMLPHWKDSINKLKDELGRCTILSTVMLAVDLSFLLVPGVITPGANASASEIITYCSVVSTITSIAFSFILWNMYSNPGLVYGVSAMDVMRTLSRTTWRMACLATIHSLPMACLTWSTILFCTALAVQIFGPKEHATTATLGVACLIFVCFGLIHIYLMWLFSRSDKVHKVELRGEDDPPPGRKGPRDDVELASGE